MLPTCGKIARQLIANTDSASRAFTPTGTLAAQVATGKPVALCSWLKKQCLPHGEHAMRCSVEFENAIACQCFERWLLAQGWAIQPGAAGCVVFLVRPFGKRA